MRNFKMRFLRDFLKGEKELIKATEVVQFNVPNYPELAVTEMIKVFKGDADLMRYLNYYDDDKNLPERDFFYGILGTFLPKYLEKVIQEQNRLRNKKTEEEDKKDTIQIREDLLRKLQNEPYLSSKLSTYIIIFLGKHGLGLSLLKTGAKPRVEPKKRKRYEITHKFPGLKEEKKDEQMAEDDA